MEKLKKYNVHAAICPDCKGNGYVKATIEEGREHIVVQCPMCKSQGEVNENKDDTMFIDADGIHRLH